MQQQWQASLSSKLASMAHTCLSMSQLKQIHAHAIVSNLHTHSVVLGKLFRFAAVSPSGDLSYAHHLFDQIPRKTGFFYNLLIRGHSQSSSPWLSTALFNRMRWDSIHPNEFTFTFLLKSRMKMSEMHDGKDDEVHGAVLKCGFNLHLYVRNSLIHLYAGRGFPRAAMGVFDEGTVNNVDVVSWSGLVLAYVKAGWLDLARQKFDEMPERDVVTWTVMISGCLKGGRAREALELFWEMSREEGLRPDEVTMVSVISACTDLGDVLTGMSVHRFIEDNGFAWMVSLCNALIDMYAKCGCIDQVWQVFIGMSRKSLITWNSMILACANHGKADDAFWLFECMISAGVPPDGITFLALIVAYTHKGLVDEGLMLFERMQGEYQIKARIEHYGCVADMLGKAGRLEEAYSFISNMPIPANDVMWGTLLTACRSYGDVYMAEKVLKRLIGLKPDEGGYYILLRDIYVAAGRMTEVDETRQAMNTNGASKTPGRSWVGGA